MGQRPESSRFMPGFIVFPGGQFDQQDKIIDTHFKLKDEDRTPVSGKCTDKRVNSLIWTAIRETWEETGLLVGRPIQEGRTKIAMGQNLTIQAFAEAGLAPDLNALIYVARAITPVSNPIRFDTRFFVADGNNIFGRLRNTNELLNNSWRKVNNVLKQRKIANVTKFALDAALRQWTSFSTTQERTIPTLYHRQGQVILRYDST